MSNSVSTFSFTNFSRKSRKHNNILLSIAKFSLNCIQDIILDLSIPFFNDSRDYKALTSSPILPATASTDGVKLL